jgi:hypothetical protein
VNFGFLFHPVRYSGRMNKAIHIRFAVIGISLLLGITCAQAHRAGEEMADAATKFLSSLKPEQSAKASFPVKGDERLNWHFIPKDRNGLPFKDMTEEQRGLALGLLKSGMSERGFGTATNIMTLELILAELEGAGRRFPRDPALYYVSIFGKPEKSGTWAWRVEGHHLAVNFTVVAGQVASTPSFFGSNPAEVRKGPRKGVRVLAQEEDAARELEKVARQEKHQLERQKMEFEKTLRQHDENAEHKFKQREQELSVAFEARLAEDEPSADDDVVPGAERLH